MNEDEITVDALGQLRAERRDVIVLDVRTAEEFAAGHVAGARHVPGAHLLGPVDPLRRADLVVTTCGKGGGRSAEAAARLRALGVRARSLAGGTSAWLAANIPTERTDP
ncbi:MAG: rhodanese-like domain-containing protein [Myxococcota bacterium]